MRVRAISNDEGNKLRTIVRRAKDPVELRRAQVVLASAQGFAAPKISLFVGMSEDYIRQLIHIFNEHGFEMLKPKWVAGGNWKFTDTHRDGLVALATSRPRDLGYPFEQWSLPRLRDAAVERGVVESISIEWLRVILDEADVSHQSVKTWKESNDPKFEEKKRRIDRLTRKRHNPPVVLSVDEIGPVSLKPHGGQGWFTRKHPRRVPATYNKLDGTRYEFLCLNVFHQHLTVKQYARKGSRPWLEFLQRERAKYPKTQRVHIIQDGFSAHWTHDIKEWAARANVSLVPTATNASWMNPVECHAGDVQKLALDGTDHPSWLDVSLAFRRAVTYRNKERALRDKRFRDTQDRRRKLRQPLWKRH
ncbi:MAG: IS630 family transposase [Thermoplasmatota archaeon]